MANAAGDGKEAPPRDHECKVSLENTYPQYDEQMKRISGLEERLKEIQNQLDEWKEPRYFIVFGAESNRQAILQNADAVGQAIENLCQLGRTMKEGFDDLERECGATSAKLKEVATNDSYRNKEDAETILQLMVLRSKLQNQIQDLHSTITKEINDAKKTHDVAKSFVEKCYSMILDTISDEEDQEDEDEDDEILVD